MPFREKGKLPTRDYRSIVRNGGPAAIADLVKTLHPRSPSTTITRTTLSSGVILISKPSKLHVSPWHMVSGALGGVPLRVASFWSPTSGIKDTKTGTTIKCRDKSLNEPGPLRNVRLGNWNGREFGLTRAGNLGTNHAKIGISDGRERHYVIFGDMNQEGLLGGDCKKSQNLRGGLFFIVEDEILHAQMDKFLSPTQ
jgi:hypothetical protein